VVNSGAPVVLPWADDVPAVLLSWFPGQEFGSALADVLLGEREPGGRLPTTWPVRMEDCPVLSTQPVDGVLRYDESIHIGYRAWARSGRTPRYPFGHGLGYTTWECTGLEVVENLDGAAAGEGRSTDGRSAGAGDGANAKHDGVKARVSIRNTGKRPGRTVPASGSRRRWRPLGACSSTGTSRRRGGRPSRGSTASPAVRRRPWSGRARRLRDRPEDGRRLLARRTAERGGGGPSTAPGR